jgi:branched-chain amino acid transport system substrate-binding protein
MTSLGLVPLLILAACGSSSKKSTATPATTAAGAPKLDTSNPYVYLFSADFTGSIQAFTAGEVQGLNAAVTDINAKGGIQGREVQLQTQNDQNDPTQAVNLLQQRLSSGKKPDAMYSGGSSAVTQAMLPILTQNKIISTDATSSDALNDPVKYPYHFGDSTLASQPLPAFIDAFKQKGYKKIAMIFANNATGQSTEASFSKGIKAAGMDFTSASYAETALDMTPQLQQLKASNPDALIFSAFGTPGLYILKNRAQLGWNLPTYADQLAASFPFTKNLKPEELTNVFVQTSAAYVAGGIASNWPLLQHVTDLVKSQPDGPKTLQNIGVALAGVGYNALILLKIATDQAGSTDPDKVKAALENLKQPSPPMPWLTYGPDGQFGSYNFSPTNHFPTVQTSAFSYVPPGSYDENGLYKPGA